MKLPLRRTLVRSYHSLSFDSVISVSFHFVKAE